MAKKDYSSNFAQTIGQEQLALDQRATASNTRLNPKVQAAAMANPSVLVNVQRFNFSALPSELAVVEAGRQRLLPFKRITTKSEIVRVGLALVAGLSDEELLAAVNAQVAVQRGAKGLRQDD